MEEMPNFSQDKQPEEPDEETVSRRELFSESWQRFRNRFDESVIERVQYSNYYEEEANSKREKDKDDDDEDELFTSVSGASSSSKKKVANRKLSKLRRRTTATTQLDDKDRSVVENIASKQADQDVITRTDVTNPEDEAVGSESDNFKIGSSVTEVRIVENGQESTAESLADQLDNENQIAQETILEDEERLTPISKILTQKKYRRANKHDGESIHSRSSDASMANSNDSEKHYTDKVSSKPTVYETTNHHYHHRRLAALDILNYGLALRRDNKNRRLSERKMKRLSDEVKKQFSKNESTLYSKKTAGNITEKVIYNNNTVVETNNNNQSVASDIVEIITTENNTKQQNHEQKVVTSHQHLETRNVEKVEGSKTESIKRKEYRPDGVIETKNEREYVKRNNAEIERLRSEYKKLLKESQMNINPKPDISPIQPAVENSNIVNKIPVSMLDTSGNQPKSNDYKQMVVPSVSGIIAGIIVFLILYMATMR